MGVQSFLSGSCRPQLSCVVLHLVLHRSVAELGFRRGINWIIPVWTKVAPLRTREVAVLLPPNVPCRCVPSTTVFNCIPLTQSARPNCIGCSLPCGCIMLLSCAIVTVRCAWCVCCRPPAALKTIKSLSAVTAGHMLLLEYLEERPLMVLQTGMGMRLTTYYRCNTPAQA
jgi:hypothetical protein